MEHQKEFVLTHQNKKRLYTMIAKAAVISHGANAVRYATEKDKAEIIKLNLLPDDIPLEGIWQRMVIHQKQFEAKLSRYRPLKNTAIRIEISPARNESEGWTHDDWERLANDFVQEFDRVNLSGRAGRASAARTKLGGSQYAAALHRDSRSGIAHLHIVANRVDMEGRVNDAHFIYERAMEAAWRINVRRGWLTAEERSEQNRRQIADDCLDVLRQMSRFDWEEYVYLLGRKGYVVNLKRDSKNIVRGYTVGKGNSVYKSSQLGESRTLIPSKIEQTWKSLHPVEQRAAAEAAGNLETQPAQKITPQPKNLLTDQPAAVVAAQPRIEPAPIVHCDIEVADRRYRVDIPKEAYLILANVLSLADAEEFAAGIVEIQKTAVLLFAGYIDAATAMSESHGGGGSAPSSDWGRDKDEDEREWARRCARMAMEMSKPHRRGWRR